MPETEPVPEPAPPPPPPPRECRRRRRSGSSASSRACRAQRRLHLGMGGGRGGGGPGAGGGGACPPAATESSASPGAPPAGWGLGRGAPCSGRPRRSPRAQQRRLRSRGGEAGATPPPARLWGRGMRGRGPISLIGPQPSCPAHGLGRIPPRSASAGYCYNPGFPGATGRGRGSEHLAPPTTPEGGVSRPLILDPLVSNL